jgi:hypothetical protein
LDIFTLFPNILELMSDGFPCETFPFSTEGLSRVVATSPETPNQTVPLKTISLAFSPPVIDGPWVEVAVHTSILQLREFAQKLHDVDSPLQTLRFDAINGMHPPSEYLAFLEGLVEEIVIVEREADDLWSWRKRYSHLLDMGLPDYLQKQLLNASFDIEEVIEGDLEENIEEDEL